MIPIVLRPAHVIRLNIPREPNPPEWAESGFCMRKRVLAFIKELFLHIKNVYYTGDIFHCYERFFKENGFICRIHYY